MAVTPLPSLSRLDPDFKAKTDTFFGSQLPTFTSEVNVELARVGNLAFGSYSATSATSVAIGTGAKSLTVETGKGFVPGQALMVANSASPGTNMIGQVSSYDPGTGALDVSVSSINGAGTYSSWSISLTAVVSSAVKTTRFQVFTSSGSWVQPLDMDANSSVKVLTISGGGGGGSGAACYRTALAYWGNGASGGGGGGSGFAIVTEHVLGTAAGTSHPVTVGAGGLGGAAVTSASYLAGLTGGTGGASSFSTYVSVAGGVGGGPGLGYKGYMTAVPRFQDSGSGGAGGNLTTVPGSVSIGLAVSTGVGTPENITKYAFTSPYVGEDYNGGYSISNSGTLSNRPLGSSCGGCLGTGNASYSTNTPTAYGIIGQTKTAAYNLVGSTFFGVSVVRTGGYASTGGSAIYDNTPSLVAGSGGKVTGTTGTAGADATGYGSGGSGGQGICSSDTSSPTSGKGGDGSPGVVVVVWESAL